MERFAEQEVGSTLMEAMITLADKWLNLRRLELSVSIDDEVATHLYQKFGFEVEGTLRDFGFRDVQYVDTCMKGRVKASAQVFSQVIYSHLSQIGVFYML